MQLASVRDLKPPHLSLNPNLHDQHLLQQEKKENHIEGSMPSTQLKSQRELFLIGEKVNFKSHPRTRGHSELSTPRWLPQEPRTGMAGPGPRARGREAARPGKGRGRTRGRIGRDTGRLGESPQGARGQKKQIRLSTHMSPTLSPEQNRGLQRH